jgi:hypothetical protein
MPAMHSAKGEESSDFWLERNHEFVVSTLITWLRAHDARGRPRPRVFVLYGGVHLENTTSSLPALLDEAGYSTVTLIPGIVELEIEAREQDSAKGPQEWLAFDQNVYRPGVLSDDDWREASVIESKRFDWACRELEQALASRDMQQAQWQLLVLAGTNRRRAVAVFRDCASRPDASGLREWLSGMIDRLQGR